jgi:hypothetical protein
MNAMNSNPLTRGRRIFRQLGIHFEDLDNVAEMLGDVQISLMVSLRESFSHLPPRTDPNYGPRVGDVVLKHLNFLCDRIKGLVDELNNVIERSRQDEGWVAYHDVAFEGKIREYFTSPLLV